MCVHITKTYLEARLPSAKNSQNLDKILKIDYNVINFEMLFLCPFTIFIYRGLWSCAKKTNSCYGGNLCTSVKFGWSWARS